MAKKSRKQQPGGTPATVALTAAGGAFTVHSYDHDPASASYGEEAAEALGVSADRVFKTLVAEVDGELVVAVVPVAGCLDLKALASAVGGKRAAWRTRRRRSAPRAMCAAVSPPWASASACVRCWTHRPAPTPPSASRRAAAAWRSSSPPRTWRL